MSRRGAATDLMEQVGDALAAPRVASVAGEKSMWWSPEKHVRTKKCRSVRSGVRNRTYIYVIPRYGSAPDHRPPEGMDQVGNHINIQNIKHARGRRGLGPKGLRAG